MNFIPCEGTYNIIGIQEIDHFTLNGERTFVFLPETHSRLTFESKTCSTNIQQQIANISKLGQHMAAKQALSTYTHKKTRKSVLHDLEEQLRYMYETPRLHSCCILISDYLLALAQESREKIDILAEVPHENREYRAVSSFLTLVGGVFLPCRSGSESFFPSANFRGLDFRANLHSTYETIYPDFIASDWELLIAIVQIAIDPSKNSDLDAIGYQNKELLSAIHDNFHESTFSSINHFQDILKHAIENTIPIDASRTSRTFRLEARLFDVNAVLVMFSKHANKTTLFMAGSGHIHFAKTFLSLVGRVQDIFHITRRRDVDLWKFPVAHREPNTNCINDIPVDSMPLLSLLPRNIDFVFANATDAELISYMESFDVPISSIAWGRRLQTLPNNMIKHGLKPRDFVFNGFGDDRHIYIHTRLPMIQLESVDAPYPYNVTSHRTVMWRVQDANMLAYRLRVYACQRIGQAMGSEMANTALAVPVYWYWKHLISMVSVNSVENEVLYIIQQKRVPNISKRMTRKQYESAERWTSRFRQEHFDVYAYSDSKETRMVFNAVKKLWLSGSKQNKNWTLWCARLFVGLAHSL